jgi:hypothetical protein
MTGTSPDAPRGEIDASTGLPRFVFLGEDLECPLDEIAGIDRQMWR